MKEKLTLAGYESAKSLVASIESQIREIESREHVDSAARERVVRSYRRFIQKVVHDINRFESNVSTEPALA